jgi:hypothetical protein
MTQTSVFALSIPPVEDFVAKAAASAHSLVVSTYNKMLADQSVGKSRKQSMELGGWGMTTQLNKEKSGALLTWTDGAIVRVSTASLYLHLLDLIVASHPIDAPSRKARQPSGSYQKGHRQAALERKEGQPIRAP